MIPLTEEQRKFAADNERLIYSFLIKHKLNIDDYYGDAAYGLCKAAATYDPTRGTFSTYACIVMQNEISMVKRCENRIIPTQSLEQELMAGGSTLEEVTGTDPDLSAVEASEQFERLKKRLNPRERKILAGFMDGKLQKNIGAGVGLSQAVISRELHKIRDLYKTGG